jgi:septal ring factor EnvC (AmiA/AmiB activator)
MRCRYRIAALVLVTAIGLAHAATPRRTEAQLQALRQRIERMTQQASHDALERDRLSADLRSAELALGRSRAQYEQLDRDYADRSARRAQLLQAQAHASQRLSSERAALAGALRAAYLMGEAEPLRLLLNQRDPLQSGRLLVYYGYFARARAAEVQTIEQELSHLTQLDAELAEEQSQLAQLRSARQAELQRLELARDARHRVLVSLTATARTRELQLARLKGQQADLERLLEQLTRSLPAAGPPDTTSAFGRLRGMLAWPVSGRVTAAFGQQRAGDVRWDGMVVATARDAPVRAVSAGRVVYADWLPGLGLLLIIDHGDGYLSLYGHNDRLLRAAGDSVSTGETVAEAGDTGGRAEPELYFELRRGGRPVDPRPWFRAHSPPP